MDKWITWPQAGYKITRRRRCDSIHKRELGKQGIEVLHRVDTKQGMGVERCCIVWTRSKA
jgi:hypothetical protein